MLQNYLKIAWRSLWRNRLYTLLNVVGLATGLSACWIIYQLVSYEFAFDKHQINNDRIYRIVTHFNYDGKQSGFPGVPLPMFTVAQTQLPGIEQTVPIRELWTNHVDVTLPKGKPARFRDVDKVIATNEGYFNLVTYQWLAGNSRQPLNQPNQIILAQSRLDRYFPGLTPQQALGKTLTYFDTLTVQVIGVVADPKQPSSFEAREFLSLATLGTSTTNNGWDDLNSANQLFVQLSAQTDVKQVEKRMNEIAAMHTESSRPKNGIRQQWHTLQPLLNIHFATDIPGSNRKANRSVLYGLMGLAGFILLLAGINYINLSTALAPARAREIGIRKTLGSRRWTLVGQFLGETLAVTLLALGLAMALAQLFFIYFGDLLPVGVETYINWPLTTAFLVILIIGVSILAGFYPALLATRAQPGSVLRGQGGPTNSTGISTLNLRKGLIVFQFIIAQVFIVGALLVGQQLRYSLEKDMGFNRDAGVLAHFPMIGTDQKANVQRRLTLQQTLSQIPGVAAVSLGNPPANYSFSTSELTLKDGNREQNLSILFKYVDTNFISLYKLPLLAGRNLALTDTLRDFVINETAVRALGFKHPQDAIGKLLYAGNTALPIVGVVKDFQVASVREKIRPTALVSYQVYSNQISIKLASDRPADWQQTLDKIGKAWTTFYNDEPFDYSFYDQTVAAFYEGELIMARIINLATGIAILLSCLGLFGLATLTAFQRTKEVGVRKVLGASIASIVTLLTKDFLKLITIAIVIATPLAWWAVSRWLEDFAYKIDLEWSVFAGAALLAICLAILTVSYQSIKAALMNPVDSLKNE